MRPARTATVPPRAASDDEVVEEGDYEVIDEEQDGEALTDASKRQSESPAQPPVRDSGPVEGVRGNREVPPAPHDHESEEVAALQAERDELFDRLQRLAAEFDNFRKRSAREQAALPSGRTSGS